MSEKDELRIKLIEKIKHSKIEEDKYFFNTFAKSVYSDWENIS